MEIVIIIEQKKTTRAYEACWCSSWQAGVLGVAPAGRHREEGEEKGERKTKR